MPGKKSELMVLMDIIQKNEADIVETGKLRFAQEKQKREKYRELDMRKSELMLKLMSEIIASALAQRK